MIKDHKDDRAPHTLSLALYGFGAATSHYFHFCVKTLRKQLTCQTSRSSPKNVQFTIIYDKKKDHITLEKVELTVILIILLKKLLK